MCMKHNGYIGHKLAVSELVYLLFAIPIKTHTKYDIIGGGRLLVALRLP